MAADGFRRNTDRGLSNVDAEDPDTRDGVRALLGGAAEDVVPDGMTDGLFPGPMEFGATAVTEVAVLVVQLLRLGSEDAAMLLLGLLAKLETCCRAWLGLPLTEVTGLVGIRLEGRWECAD